MQLANRRDLVALAFRPAFGDLKVGATSRLGHHLLRIAELSDKPPHSPTPLPKGARGGITRVYALAPLGRGWRAAPGDGLVRHYIM